MRFSLKTGHKLVTSHVNTAGTLITESRADNGSWVKMGRLRRMGHMGQGSEGVDP
jgi:hypothetical protein